MVPIHELLARIRWDPQFGRGEFAVGYLDRVAGGIVTVPFAAIRFPEAGHFAFEVTDDEGVVHTIPYHRVRQVIHDGKVIWQRDD